MAVASSGVGALLAARTQTAHKGGRAAGCLAGGVSRTAVCGNGTVMADFSATVPLIDGKVATVGRILESDIFSMKVLSDTSIRPTACRGTHEVRRLDKLYSTSFDKRSSESQKLFQTTFFITLKARVRAVHTLSGQV